VIDAMLADVTVSVSLAETAPDVALMAEVPAARPRASPVASIEATGPADEDHITEDVMSCEEPSEYLPIAASFWVSPLGILGFVGVMARDSSVADVVVRTALAEIEPNVAAMFAVPVATACATPDASTVAIATLSDDHVTDEVMFSAVPSE
jgi:hypothetical protein